VRQIPLSLAIGAGPMMLQPLATAVIGAISASSVLSPIVQFRLGAGD